MPFDALRCPEPAEGSLPADHRKVYLLQVGRPVEMSDLVEGSAEVIERLALSPVEVSRDAEVLTLTNHPK